LFVLVALLPLVLLLRLLWVQPVAGMLLLLLLLLLQMRRDGRGQSALVLVALAASDAQSEEQKPKLIFLDNMRLLSTPFQRL
jgi:cytochrome c-type biogenesis protein CcmH/NrfF